MITLGNKKIENISIENRKVSKAYLKNKLIYSSGPKIVSFSEGTDEEIAKMLDAHYAGTIDIADYWNVGDERKIHLNASSFSSTTHVAQDIIINIIGINHDDLQTKQGVRDKSAITVQCREMLGSNGISENDAYWGTTHYPVKDTENYTANPLRTWFNNGFIDAISSSIFRNLIKTVVKKNLAKHTTSEGSPVNSEDKAFLLSYPEVFGTAKYLNYLYNNEVGEWEGTQYEYYKIDENRVKYGNDNGNKGSSPEYWWLRSPSSEYSGRGYFWCFVHSNGTANSQHGVGSYGLALAFCL